MTAIAMKVRTETYETLRELAEAEGTSMQEVL